jgi:HEAT repeat protein
VLKNGDDEKAAQGLRSRDLKQRLAHLERVTQEPNSRETLHALLEALQDDSWHLRQYAAKGLVQVGGKAVPHLIRLLTEGVWFVRSGAASALGEIGREQAFDPLTRLVNDENMNVRRQTILALARISAQIPASRAAQILAQQALSLRQQVLEALETEHPERALELRTLSSRGAPARIPFPSDEGESSAAQGEALRRFRQALAEAGQEDVPSGRHPEQDEPKKEDRAAERRGKEVRFWID